MMLLKETSSSYSVNDLLCSRTFVLCPNLSVPGMLWWMMRHYRLATLFDDDDAEEEEEEPETEKAAAPQPTDSKAPQISSPTEASVETNKDGAIKSTHAAKDATKALIFYHIMMYIILT